MNPSVYQLSCSSENHPQNRLQQKCVHLLPFTRRGTIEQRDCRSTAGCWLADMLCVRDAWLNQSARRTVGPFGFERFTPPHNFGIDEFVASWLHNYLWSTSTRAKVLSLEIKTCIEGFPPQ